MSQSYKSSEVQRHKELRQLVVAGRGGRSGNARHTPGCKASMSHLFSDYPVVMCGMV